ncbi:DNA-binding response regulator [Stagnimonas aquatica]|uniref:DNA-binding response regulator n=1 Tax=Stagnimonas aquatica TaxID=2689987 RepID=A0A3N0VH54_9GAMM|nr:response regulator transcription factor [Stagnimonas aquatica]ROH92032.1 DNA-binding response regulator [Stagnimonas aquatica]
MQSGWIVEDHPDVALGLAAALQGAFPGIALRLVDGLEAALQQLREGYRPDIALIDLGLPDGSGLDLLRALPAAAPGCVAVVTTIYADDAHLFPALRAGAAGYLLKDEPRERLESALRGILAGEPPLSPSIARRVLRTFAEAASAPAQAAEEDAHLSPRERETLMLIGKGYKLPEVAEALGITRTSAATYIKTVYRKLAISSRAEAALVANRLGLVQ